MRFLVRSIVLVNAAGAVVALRQRQPARFAGIALPGPPGLQALTVGTAMSAPPVMLGLLLAAARRRRTDIVQTIAVVSLVGILGEPHSWVALGRPAADPASTACVVLEIALPAALLRTVAVRRSRVA